MSWKRNKLSLVLVVAVCGTSLARATVPTPVAPTASVHVAEASLAEDPQFFGFVFIAAKAVVAGVKAVVGTAAVKSVAVSTAASVAGNGVKNVVNGDGFFYNFDDSIAYGIGAGFGYWGMNQLIAAERAPGYGYTARAFD